MGGKKVLGTVEQVIIKSNNGDKLVEARIDTGAKLSSIDTSLVAELGLGPIVKAKKIKSAQGRSLRAVIKVRIILKGEEFNEDFTITDRSHMSYPVLIGRNILGKGFIIDPSKKVEDESSTN